MNPVISGRRAVSLALAALLVTFGLAAATTPLAHAAAGGSDPTPTLALNTVAQFQGVWTSPPTNLGGGETTDAPLMGNGDVGVAVGGRREPGRDFSTEYPSNVLTYRRETLL